MSLIYQCFYDENTDVSDNMNIENLSIFRKIKIKIILIDFTCYYDILLNN